jgi:hypothetical protein
VFDDEAEAELADEADEIAVDLVVVNGDAGLVFVFDDELV